MTGNRTMEDLKSRLGLGRRGSNGGPQPPEQDAEDPGAKPGPTPDEQAAIVALIVEGFLARYRPWLALADTTVPAVAKFIGEAVEAVRHAAVELEDQTTPYSIELMKRRTANRKRQLQCYLDEGFTREEALQLLVAGFSKDDSLGEKLIDRIGDALLTALDARAKKA